LTDRRDAYLCPSPRRPFRHAPTNSPTPLPFSRGTYYRWEKRGIIPPLLRLGGKTLISADTIEDILSGKITLPHNAGRVKPPKPLDRGGHPKRGHAVAKPPAATASAE
jgi:hypothetical protein